MATFDEEDIICYMIPDEHEKREELLKIKNGEIL